MVRQLRRGPALVLTQRCEARHRSSYRPIALSPRHRLLVGRGSVALAGDAISISVQLVWIGGIGPQHRLGLGLTGEVPAVERIALPDVEARVEPFRGRWRRDRR